MSYELIDSKSKLEMFIAAIHKAYEDDLVIACDTETGWDTEDPDAGKEDVFDPYTAKLVGISFSWKEGTGYYIPFEGKGYTFNPFFVLQDLKAVLETGKIVWHNAKFDWKMLYMQGIDAAVYADTMVDLYILFANEPVGLKENAKKHFGVDVVTFDEMSMGSSSLTEMEISDVYRYACQDADLTLRLYNRFDAEAQRLAKFIYSLDLKNIKPLAKMELEGVPINVELLPGVRADIQKRMDELAEEIFVLVGSSVAEDDELAEDLLNRGVLVEHHDDEGKPYYRLPFRIHAPGDLGEVLFNYLGFKPRGKSKKTGRPTCDKNALEKLKGAHPAMPKIIEWRHYHFSDMRYIKDMEKYQNRKTNRVHASFKQCHVPTGRFACGSPNLQQWPSTARRIVEAPDGWYWFSADYAQIEFRVMVSMAGEEKLIEAINNGEDVHTAVYGWMFGRDPKTVTKEERAFGKTLNFGLIYGMESAGLEMRSDLTKEQAERAIELYMDTLPKVRTFIKSTASKAHERGFVKTHFGRLRELKTLGINSHKPYEKAFAERSAVNTIIQGTAADIMRIAITRVDKEIRDRGLEAKVKLVMTIHDELVFLVRDDVSVEEMKDLARKSMIFPLVEGWTPMELGFEVSTKSWGDMEELPKDSIENGELLDSSPEPTVELPLNLEGMNMSKDDMIALKRWISENSTASGKHYNLNIVIAGGTVKVPVQFGEEVAGTYASSIAEYILAARQSGSSDAVDELASMLDE